MDASRGSVGAGTWAHFGGSARHGPKTAGTPRRPVGLQLAELDVSNASIRLFSSLAPGLTPDLGLSFLAHEVASAAPPSAPPGVTSQMASEVFYTLQAAPASLPTIYGVNLTSRRVVSSAMPWARPQATAPSNVQWDPAGSG